MKTSQLSALAHPFGPFGLEKSRQISAKNCRVFDLTIDNTGAADWYVQIWDVAAAGDVSGTPSAATDGFPVAEGIVPNGSFLPFGWDGGYQFKRGLYVRCVTARGGSTPISGSEAKFSGRFLNPFPIST